MEYGYALSCEEHPPGDLLSQGRRAEELGLDFLSVTDHYHPWVSVQGQASFVWSLLGALAAGTDRIRVGTGVTCPIQRIHPAVVAQAAATTAALFGDRFFFGVGTGEALNEHVTGQRWPPVDIRQEMLAEAVQVIRELWTGENVDHHGRHYRVENARLFTLPERPPPVVVSGLGPRSAALAARIGDGYWGTAPKPDLLAAYADAGGEGPRYGQVTVCVAPTVEEGRRTVHTRWPNAAVPGQLSRDLPTVTHFEQAAAILTEEQAVDSFPCGPDPGPVLESVQKYTDAGYTHLYFHQVGPDQEGFLRLWRDELAPALGR